MLRFFAIGMLLPASLFGSFYRADKSFNDYVAFAQAKVKGSVFVTQHKKTENNTTYINGCSGTILNPWTVLTAGHCVVNDADQITDPQKMSVGYSPVRTDLITKYKAKRISLNAGYTPTKIPGQVPSYDIALLHLETPIYLSPILYGQLSSTPPSIGDTVIGYGYGSVNKLDGSDPRPNNNQLLAYQTVVKERDFNPPYYGTELQLVYDLSQPYAGNCDHGDSGGGIIDKNGKIIGVTTSRDRLQAIPKYMNIVDTTSSAIRTFLTNYNTDWKHATWSGSGKVSDPANWGGSPPPQNHIRDDKDIHYDITEIREKTEIIVDKNLHVDRFVLNHRDSSFSVEKDQIATLDHGLDLQQGKSRVDGTMRAKFLHVGKGVTHSSPPGFTLSGEGTLDLDGGKVEAPIFLMQGGYIEGNGAIFSSSFTHKKGTISPQNGNRAGNILIHGTYQSSKESQINIRLFNDGTNDKLMVASMKPSVMSFNFLFPDNLVKYNKTYTVFTSGNGIQVQPAGKGTVALFSKAYTDTLHIERTMSYDGGAVTITPISSQPRNTVTSDMRPNIHNAFNALYSHGNKHLNSFFERVQSMPQATFSKALYAFSNPQLHKNLQKAFLNTSLQDLYKAERTELFLEKSRQAIDFKSFSFISKNSFSGEEMLIHEKENTPFSLFISGDLHDHFSTYTTDGITFGGDYADGSTLTGLSMHFKNTLSNKYHFDLYHAKRGSFYFYDYSFGHGVYTQDLSDDNIWGKWNAHIISRQTRLDSRLGIYNIDSRFFSLGYIGLSGSFSKVDPFSTTIDQNLKMNTSESKLSSITTKIGLEHKIKYHFGDIIIEPAIHTSLSFSLFDSFTSPENTFEGASNAPFYHEAFSLNKTHFFLNFALRIYVPHNAILKIEMEGTRQYEETHSKGFLGLNIKL